ncbi:hypothetical protein EYF80_026344 [Liparis tanakae]|uniref:Uncharacterized protein n=1 Tax=Liparis tanakae TaxID=230148 RepID=A0A4Z2HEZ7_9TELE|nr:hypothetical protein EYF80_026344 [Liparis tanakae]
MPTPSIQPCDLAEEDYSTPDALYTFPISPEHMPTVNAAYSSSISTGRIWFGLKRDPRLAFKNYFLKVRRPSRSPDGRSVVIVNRHWEEMGCRLKLSDPPVHADPSSHVSFLNREAS